MGTAITACGFKRHKLLRHKLVDIMAIGNNNDYVVILR